MRTTNNQNNVLIIIVVIFAFLLILLILFVQYNNKKQNKSFYEKEAYRGIVHNVFSEPNNHGTTFLTIYTEKDTFLVSPSNWPYLHSYVEPGDSLIKLADTLTLYIKKRNGTARVIKYKEEEYSFLPYFWIIVFTMIIIYNIQKGVKNK